MPTLSPSAPQGRRPNGPPLKTPSVFQVALTGNIAAGKSTVAEHLTALGATRIDADAIARELQQPGTPVLQAIVQRFGSGILTPQGALDRPALRAIVFADPAARADLEAIVHPAVAVERDVRVAAAAAAGATIIVSEIPLLFESGDPGAFDLVVLVDALPKVRRTRLIADRGLTPVEADAALAAQAAAEPKRARSDIIIDNDGDRDALERATHVAWDRIRAAASA